MNPIRRDSLNRKKYHRLHKNTTNTTHRYIPYTLSMHWKLAFGCLVVFLVAKEFTLADQGVDCKQYSNCGNCILNGCGYCLYSYIYTNTTNLPLCTAGNESGPFNSSECLMGWAFAKEHCVCFAMNDIGPTGPSCEQCTNADSSCGACTYRSLPGFTWCLSGNKTGPFQAGCDRWTTGLQNC